MQAIFSDAALKALEKLLETQETRERQLMERGAQFLGTVGAIAGALIATAVGLFVVIPAVALYNLLKARVRKTMDFERRIYLDGEETDSARVTDTLRDEVSKDPAHQVLIAADQRLLYEDVVRLLDWVKGSGVRKYALKVSRPE